MMRSWLTSRKRSEKSENTTRSSESAQADGFETSSSYADLKDTDVLRQNPYLSVDGRHGAGIDSISNNCLGLQVVHSPDSQKVDIIFVHGLGGTSHGTWTKHKDAKLFWPGTFLPSESGIEQARISTFGYRADIFKSSESSVLDFAKELLYEMKFAKDEYGKEAGFGEKPIIFVAHSMGGLTVKEAYLQGQHDPDYSNIIKAVVTIVFLSTPHRGADLAETLNRIVQATCLSAPKAYIADLARNSVTVQRINESFRHYVVPRLQIVSFYETKQTAIGPTKTHVMVVKKDSSVLGYPGETSRGLDADHNGVCKFASRTDPNYVAVRNYLKTTVSKLLVSCSSKATDSSVASNSEVKDLENLFRISEPPDTDFIFFRDRWVPGTNEWILHNEIFHQWLKQNKTESNPKLLWIQGSPGSGKSVLSSFIINELVERNESCQYFYIRYGDQSKRSLRTMLNHLAFQTAQVNAAVRRSLSTIIRNLKARITDSRYIWQHVYKNIIFKQEFAKPVYWIIDGLEECDDPRAASKMLSEMMTLGLSIPIRILVTSRRTADIESEFRKVLMQNNLYTISLDDQQTDFKTFIEHELMWNDVPGFNQKITKRLLSMAGNSFLWLSLTIDRINRCHTEESVEHVLQQLPPDMEDLYIRMASSITDLDQVDLDLASSIFTWITCVRRNLTLMELEDALLFGKGRAYNLQRSLTTLCAGFAVVDNDGFVSLVHRTAAEFLLSDTPDTRIRVQHPTAHQQILVRCLRCMTSAGLRLKLSRNQAPVLLSYASTFWATHLAYCDPSSDDVIHAVGNLLNSHAILIWILFVAKQGSLKTLLQASVHISVFCRKRRIVEACRVATERTAELLQLMEGWSTELGRIVGKFGSQLLRQPNSIFATIPPFCPANSMLRKQFLREDSQSISVSTTYSATDWEDGIAVLPLDSEYEATGLTAEGPWVAVLCHTGSHGTVLIYHCTTHQRHRALDHGERVRRMQMNAMGSLLVTCGISKTKVWDVASGDCVQEVRNPVDKPRPQTIIFSTANDSLMIGTDDRRFWSIQLINAPNISWEIITRVNEMRGDGGPLNSPTCMAISPDGERVALGYRLRPLSIWDLDSSELLVMSSGLMRTAHVIWHPDPAITEIFGIMLHLGGRVFKWHLDEPEPIVLYVEASSICVNHDGTLLALGDQHGNIKLLNTTDLSFVYYMAAQDPVLGVSFSMDSRHLYDVRYSHANVWQPNVLLKLAETTSQPSDGGIDAERALIELSWDPLQTPKYTKVDPITALGAQTNGGHFCSGTLEGALRLHTLSGRTIGQLHHSSNFFSIQHIAWSHSEKLVCYADVSRTIFLDSIKQGSDDTIRILELRLPELQDNVDQIVFDPYDNLVLISSSSTAVIVSISNKEVVAKRDVGPAARGCFTQHGLDDSLLLYVEPCSISAFTWSDLQVTAIFELSKASQAFFAYGDCSDTLQGAHGDSKLTRTINDRMELVVAEVSLSPSKEYLLVKAQASPERSFMSLLSLRSAGPHFTVETIPLPHELGHRMRCPFQLRTVENSSESLIFLDNDGWICSFPVTDCILRVENLVMSRPQLRKQPSIISHYCLPGDWTSPENVSLIQLVGKGMLLCPKNGEVAVVQCSDFVI